MNTKFIQNHFEKIKKAMENLIEIEFIDGLKIEVDKEKYEEFIEWQKKVQLPLDKLGAIGGEFTYSITPTSLGCVYKVYHSNGENFDLTAYELW